MRVICVICKFFAVDPVCACLAVFCLECLIVVFSVEAYKFAIEPVNGSIAAVCCTAWICLIGVDPSAGAFVGQPASALGFQRANSRGCVLFSLSHLLYSFSQASLAIAIVFFQSISCLRPSSCLQFTPAQRSQELMLPWSDDEGVANLLNEPSDTENRSDSVYRHFRL